MNTNYQKFFERCKYIRKKTIQISQYDKRGHIPSALSIVEILVVLYDHILQFDPNRPDWEDRDRFILSKGHGCLSLYALLEDKGFITEKDLTGYCKFDGKLGGHPTKEKIPGVEASTGSLGHGLSLGVGFAINAKLEQKKYRTYVLLGDGECNEGSVWEAALAASHHQLDNLVALIDYNKYQSFAHTKDVCNLEPFAAKWKAFGFNTFEIDMVHSPFSLFDLLSKRESNYQPTAIICHTIKGMGVSFMENDLNWHHKAKISDDEYQKIFEAIDKQHA